MATESTTITAGPPPAYDPNCVACMLEYNEWLERGLAALRQENGDKYDQHLPGLRWPFPKNPKACLRHQGPAGPVNGDTTRMRAVRPVSEPAPAAPPTETPAAKVPSEPLPAWLDGALPATPTPAPKSALADSL